MLEVNRFIANFKFLSKDDDLLSILITWLYQVEVNVYDYIGYGGVD